MKSGEADIAHEAEVLFTGIGIPGSGSARYSAAMSLYNEGLVSGELLEIYRRCCKFDNENPVALAKHEGIATVSKKELTNIAGFRK